jgi:hypothetical protein
LSGMSQIVGREFQRRLIQLNIAELLRVLSARK